MKSNFLKKYFQKEEPKEKISSLIENYKRKVEEYGKDPLISRIDIQLIKNIENNGPKELQIEVEKLRACLEGDIKYNFDENKITLFAAYNEILNICKL